MVALFVTLKLRMLGNGLRSSNLRLALGTIGLVIALGTTLSGVLLTARLHDAGADTARTVLVVAGSVAVLGWALLPVLFFGVDETVDPRRFALMPVPRRTVLLGMLVAGCVGLPAAVTATIALSTGIAWARGALPLVYAVLGAALGTLLCVVASRTTTSAASGVLRTRRMRDLTSVVAVLLVSSAGLILVGGLALTRAAGEGLLDRLVSVLAWTPLGAAWAAPYDAVAGAPLVGLARLGVAAAAVVILLAVWDATLRTSLENGATSSRAATRRGGALAPAWARRLLPGTTIGAIAARVLVYWWRDPRQRVTLLVLPIAMAGLLLAPTMAGGTGPLFLLAGPMTGTILGLATLNHTAFDATAIWSHLAAGISGSDDRAGRALGTAMWALPIAAVAAVAGALAADATDLLPATLGGALATYLVGSGIGALASVVVAFPAPPPGANPFASVSGGSLVLALQQMLGGMAVVVLSLPVYAGIAAAVLVHPAFGWALLVVGPAYGWAILRIGGRVGGRYFDENGPEILRRITPTRS